MILSKLHNLKSHRIDYVQAFLQADLKDEVYMTIPERYEVNDGKPEKYVLKLNKNLYGLRQAAFNWFEYSKGLTDRGFVPSKVDPCLFISSDSLVLVYVDDTTIFAKKGSTINQIVKSLSSDFDLTDEGGVENFLGVNMKHHEDGSIEYT